MAISPNSSSRDGSVERPFNMTSSHHNSAGANRRSVNPMPIALGRIDRTEATLGADRVRSHVLTDQRMPVCHICEALAVSF